MFARLYWYSRNAVHGVRLMGEKSADSQAVHRDAQRLGDGIRDYGSHPDPQHCEAIHNFVTDMVGNGRDYAIQVFRQAPTVSGLNGLTLMENAAKAGLATADGSVKTSIHPGNVVETQCRSMVPQLHYGPFSAFSARDVLTGHHFSKGKSDE